MVELTWHDGPAWHERLNSAASIYSETGDRRRRHHRKSRNGCAHCRKRRVKCSEDRPTCHDCSRLHVKCQYSPRPHIYGDDSDAAAAAATAATRLQGEGVADTTVVLIPPTGRTSAWSDTFELDADLINFRPLLRSHAPESLDHFVRCDRSWLKNPTIQQIMQRDAISQVVGQPYLLHAVLAVSAAHLAAISPEGRSYCTASLVHWQMFLRTYGRCLQGDLSSQNVDAIFFASHLHSMLVAVHERHRDPEGGWVLPGWIQSMQGVKALWDTPYITTQLRSGVWKPWMQRCEPAYQRAVGDPAAAQQGISPVLAALRHHCRSLLDGEARACEERVDLLSVAEDQLPSPQGLNCLSWYIARAPADYLARLRRYDEASLLLQLYWCRLAIRAGQWWLKQAARHEAEGLCAYLSRTYSSKTISELLRMIIDIK